MLLWPPVRTCKDCWLLLHPCLLLLGPGCPCLVPVSPRSGSLNPHAPRLAVQRKAGTFYPSVSKGRTALWSKLDAVLMAKETA